MSYMFNRYHFLQSLHLSCPQLDFYIKVDDILHREAINPPFALKPEDLQAPIPRTGLPWPDDFAAWLARQAAGTTPVLATTIVEL